MTQKFRSGLVDLNGKTYRVTSTGSVDVVFRQRTSKHDYAERTIWRRIDVNGKIAAAAREIAFRAWGIEA